jgi:Ribbon-helix-helix protein, copG family
MPQSMRTVSLRLSEQLDDELIRLARFRNTSRSALVREALTSFANGGRRSVTAMVDRYVGTLNGPHDLSTNPKYMVRYGC